MSKQTQQAAPTKTAANAPKQSSSQIIREVYVRNKNTHYLVRWMIILFLLEFILTIFMMFSAIYFSGQNAPAKYVPTDNQMRYFTPVAKTEREKFKSDRDVATFATTAMRDLFMFDWINASTQLNRHQKNFTSHGWDNLVKEFYKSNMIKYLIEDKGISNFELNTGDPTGAVKVHPPRKKDNGRMVITTRVGDKKVNSEVAYWIVELTGFLNTAKFGDGTMTNDSRAVRIFLTIVRVSTLENEEGIAIHSMVIKER